MSSRLYMDVHIPSAITSGLGRRGVDVLTSQEDGSRQYDDEKLLPRATELGRALFSQDEDLLVVAATLQKDAQDFSGVVYAHQIAVGVGTIIEHLEILAQ